MFKTILVPLDGSALAGNILPHVREIARSTHARIVLLRVTPEPINLYPSTGVSPYQRSTPMQDRDATNYLLRSDPTHRAEWIEHEVETAQAYLDAISLDLKQSGAQVTTLTQPGAAAEVILEAIDREGADLIAMSTHGRSGLGRLLLGSVADRVLHLAQVPVFLLRSKNAENEPAMATNVTYKRLLVPIDGSPLASAALPYARELALCTGAEVLLLQVIPAQNDWPYTEQAAFLTGALLRGAKPDDQPNEAAWDLPLKDTFRVKQAELIRETAQNSLDVAAAELTSALKIETMILSGAPARVILDVAKQCCVDCIAMSTHGRSGIDRLLMGSVAEHVVRHSELPVLLVRALKQEREEN